MPCQQLRFIPSRSSPLRGDRLGVAVTISCSCFFLQALFNLLIPDHAADAFSPPRLSEPGFWDGLLERLLGGLSRWDAEHFLFIAEHGYVYEHNCAFFPLFPLSLRMMAETALSPFRSFLCLRSRLLLSAALLNTLFSALASWALYELSCLVLWCRRRAFLSAILFCLSPANIFMAAAYSESMFAFLTFAAMRWLEKGQRWASVLLFSLATGVRSNGLINAGFLLYSQTKRFVFQLQMKAGTGVHLLPNIGHFLNLAASLVLMATLVCSPFALFQFYAYLHFCNPEVGPEYAVPGPLLQLALDKGYHVAASDGGKPPWCFWDFPVLYTYIQDAYWNVGFLRYFEPKQIPNFLLAAPAVALGVGAAWWYFMADPWHCLTLGLVRRRRRTGGRQGEDTDRAAAGFSSPDAFVYVVHATALLVFGTFCMHVQVLTRFLGSSSPVLYWFSAQLLYDHEPLLQNERRSSWRGVLHSEKPSLDNSLPNWARNKNPVCVLLSNWRHSATLTKCILGYALSYWLLGLGRRGRTPPGLPRMLPARAATTRRGRLRLRGRLRPPRRRKWEVFPGRNRFYCGGRLMLARHSGVFLLTLGLILLWSSPRTVYSWLFFYLNCPFLARNLTLAIPIIAGILFFFVISSLLQTSFRDPGILPRATASEAADLEKWIDNLGTSTYRPPARTMEVVINKYMVKLKYCYTCKMFRPPRTSHCSVCDNCVERFDHHCPWVGNCVGKRNYRFFYAFILSLSFLTAFIFACVITHLALRNDSQGGILLPNDMHYYYYYYYFLDSHPTVLELVICFFSVWSIFGLSGFHTYLVASNLTTNEDLKGAWSSKRGSEFANPYSHKSVLTNCCAVLCGPFYPSLIDRRGFIQADAGTPSTPKSEIPSFGTKSDASMV
ncbi:hypothetical protein JRQ81_011831 [Phrynocephalus forsythii]|uniref:Palmitoyltransferase n=1 Tax=Phrynocephalus forsythii TaxID=171643 RepID=A0A9Q1AQH8_9SAUR|nr:hypothetical protein JRQ81_011831 [Phrynocephalus forsythii]